MFRIDEHAPFLAGVGHGVQPRAAFDASSGPWVNRMELGRPGRMTFAPRRLASLVFALVLGALTARAEAQVEIDPCVPLDGISTCVPADNLWPYVGGGRWFWQAPTDTAAELSASFG